MIRFGESGSGGHLIHAVKEGLPAGEFFPKKPLGVRALCGKPVGGGWWFREEPNGRRLWDLNPADRCSTCERKLG